MIFIKWTILILIFFISCLIGIMLANKYRARVNELKDIKYALNILKTKMKYTYEPLPVIFDEISDKFSNNVRNII